MLDREVSQAAHLLYSFGVGRGDRVAVMMRNGAPYVLLYYAAARIGALLAGVNWRLAAPEIAGVLADAEPALLLHDEEFGALAAEGCRVAAAEGVRLPQRVAWDAPLVMVLSAQPTERPDAVVEPGDALVLVYTSGTTGRPKGVVLTHAQMLAASTTMAFTHDYRHGDVNLLPVPMFHVGGLSFATLFAQAGATLLPLAGWDAGHALDLIAREHVAHFFAVPTMLRALLEHPRFAHADLASLRWILSGGAPVAVDLITAFADRGIPVLQTYGASETAGPATAVDLAHARAKAGSAGLPYFCTDVRVVNDAGREAAAGEIGEVQIRAAHVFSGYWRNSEATAAAFAGDWLRTGDLGSRDDDGYLYLRGRASESIISGGENIYPAEVESVLEAHPAIAEVAVVGAAEPRWGEIVCAVVRLREGAAISLDEIRTFCTGRIARYKVPRLLVTVEKPLPRNASGKLIRKDLRALAPAAREASQNASPGADSVQATAASRAKSR
jgi:fatty-acyl-CoA synthase